MAAPGVPTFLVKLDDGTGTFPNDITQFVREVEGYAWGRGRPDEHQAIQPGPLTMVLDNTDGRFTFGNVTYNIAPDRQIRLSVNGAIRWTGRMVGMPVSWPGGDDTFSLVILTAIDPLATLSRRKLGSSSDEEILADAPEAYYPLSEAAGRQKASDISGNNQPRLIAFAPNTRVAFGTALGTPDGATGVMLTNDGVLDAYLEADAGAWTSPSIHVNFLLFVPTLSLGVPNTAQVLALTNSGGGLTLTIRGDALFTVSGGHGTFTLPFGNQFGFIHVVGLNINSASTDLWIDGAKVSAAAGITTTWDNTAVILGDNRLPGITAPPSIQVFGRFAYGAHITDARMTVEQNAMLLDLSGETPTARVARVAGYAGVATGTLDSTGGTTLGPALQLGKSALDVLVETSAADLGDAYADNNGAISYTSGLTVMGKATPDAILDARWVSEDTAPDADMVGVVNDLTGTSTGTGNSYRRTDPTSIFSPGFHGVYPDSVELNVDSDSQVQDRVDWAVNNYSKPLARFSQLKLDLLSMDATSLAAALALDVDKYLRVTGMPSQTPGGTQVDVIVKQVTETFKLSGGDGDEWSLTLNVVQRSLIGAWVLDDPVWSVLDSTTKLGV